MFGDYNLTPNIQIFKAKQAPNIKIKRTKVHKYVRVHSMRKEDILVDILDYSFYKEELQKFADSLGLKKYGTKRELAKRIAKNADQEFLTKILSKLSKKDLRGYLQYYFGVEMSSRVTKEELVKTILKKTKSHHTSKSKGTYKETPVSGEYISKIIREFKRIEEPVSARDEADFEKQLLSFLKGKLSEKRPKLLEMLKRQATVGKYRIDIAFGSQVGIEIKLPKSTSSLQRLSGQVDVYKDYFKHIIVVIGDIGKKNLDIKEWAKKIRKKGAIVIVIKTEQKK